MSFDLTVPPAKVMRMVPAMLVGLAFVILSAAPRVGSGDELKFKQANETHQLKGKILIEAEDGGCLFQDNRGKLWLVQTDEIESKSVDEASAQPLSATEMSEALLQELPDGFRVEVTDHFVVAYNTERSYAKYISGMYERLLRGFTTYWKSRNKWKLEEPKQPLCVIVFRNYDEYAEFVRRDINSEPPGVAYYGILSNRVVMYDLTSTLSAPNQRPVNDRQINEILASPNAFAMIMTIVHEGTHQLMFNMGMQNRLAATPLWVNEGLAMYFETPDLSAGNGWRAVGQINQVRLVAFRNKLASQPRGLKALEELLTRDDVFKDPDQLLDRYAEAWALNYFLLTKKSKPYVEYLKFLSQKEPLIEDSEATRLADFKQFFEEDLATLDAEFVAFIRSLN